VDARTDLWALGVVMYELITGRHPFPGDYEQAVVYGILNEDPQPLTAVRSGLPTSMDWIVGKLLAKKKEERYQNASDLLVDLKTADLTQAGLSRVSSASVSSIAPVSSPSASSGAKTLPYALLALGLLIGFSVAFVQRPALEPAPIRHFEKDLQDLSSARQLALSNSGRYMAVTAQDSTSLGSLLRIYDFQDDAWSVIPNSTSAEWSRFSDDESRITFVSMGRLKQVPVSGGQPTELANSGAPPFAQFSDGRLLFSTSVSSHFVLNTDGSTEPFHPADSTISSFWFDEVLPDQNSVLITQSINGKFILHAINTETKEATEIMPNGAWLVRYVRSGHLLVQSTVDGRIQAYPFDSKTLQITGVPELVSTGQSDRDWWVTQTGHFLEFQGNQSAKWEMLLLDDSGILTPFLDEQMNFEEFQLSPDGTKLAAEINTFQNGSDQIMFFDLRSNASHPVTFLPASHYEPSWSPDGSRLAVASDARGAQNIALLNLDGSGNKTWLTDNQEQSQAPDWSPNGEFVVYYEGDDKSGNDIWMYSFADSSATALVAIPGDQTYPRISPNNRFIAYQSSQSGENQIFVYDLQTGASPVVTLESGDAPVWGAEGKQIFFRHGNELKTVPVDISTQFTTLGQPTLVTRVGQRFWFDIGPDNEIVISKEQTRGSATVSIVLNRFSPGKDN